MERPVIRLSVAVCRSARRAPFSHEPAATRISIFVGSAMRVVSRVGDESALGRQLPAGATDAFPLSPREQAVVERLIEGLGLKQAAAEFGISVHTASTYLLRARRKYRSPSRWKLAALLLGSSCSFTDVLAHQADFSAAELLLGASVIAGLSNREIGRRMGVREAAVGRLVSRLLKKVNVNTRAGLFAYAFERRRRSASGDRM
jgi:DNA-binding CsgD family transcriptional regulator